MTSQVIDRMAVEVDGPGGASQGDAILCIHGLAQGKRGSGAAGERGHAGRPNMPWGRIASTATMMRKV